MEQKSFLDEAKRFVPAMAGGLAAFFILGAINYGANAILSARQIADWTPGYGNTIAVSGEGSVFAIPDIAEITYTVTKEGKDPAAAQAAVKAAADAALKAVRDLGIEEKDIRTIGISTNPRYEYEQVACMGGYCPPGNQRIAGYEVSQTVSVKVRDTEKATSVLTGINAAGVTNVSGPSFTIDDMSALETEARSAAIADAKEKAKVLARELGVKLGDVVSFSEDMYGSPVPMYAGREMVMDASKGMNLDLPTGESEIKKMVTVIYQLK